MPTTTRPGTRLAHIIAAGFGAGAAPRAPGTAGSLVGLALGALLLQASPTLLFAGTILATYGGLWAIAAATGLPLRAPKGAPETAATHADPGWIVIDEIAGQMLTLVALHHTTPLGLLAAFALFRFFDITKPGPIAWADRQGGAAGIMADDLLAGLASALCLLLLQAVLGHML